MFAQIQGLDFLFNVFLFSAGGVLIILGVPNYDYNIVGPKKLF